MTTGIEGAINSLMIMAIQILLTLILGATIGISAGALIARSNSYGNITLQFFRLGLWLPILASWALPVLPFKESQLGVSILMVLVLSILAIASFCAYHYLKRCLILGASWRHSSALLMRRACIQTIFVSLIFQLRVNPWSWFPDANPNHIPSGYTGLLLILSFFVLLDHFVLSKSEETAPTRPVHHLGHLSEIGKSNLSGTIIVTLSCIAVWQILSLTGLHSIISSPVEVVKVGYHLLVAGPSIKPLDELWKHVAISLFEIAAGLVIGSSAGFLAQTWVPRKLRPGTWSFHLLDLLIIFPVLLVPYLRYWLEVRDIWETTGVVALFSCFGSIAALRDINGNEHTCFGFLLALDEVLPFAFLGMLLGEGISATAGMGFFMVVAVAALEIPKSIFMFVLTSSSFIVILALIRIMRGGLRRFRGVVVPGSP